MNIVKLKINTVVVEISHLIQVVEKIHLLIIVYLNNMQVLEIVDQLKHIKNILAKILIKQVLIQDVFNY